MSFGLASLRGWFGGARDGRRAAAPAGRWIVVDTETSGLDPERDRLLAIGGVAVDDDGILIDDSFEIVLRSDPTEDAANVAVHGIGYAAQAAGVAAPEALAAFRAWAGGAPRVGYHADFDRAVLRRAQALAGMAADDAPWLDLAPLASALVPASYTPWRTQPRRLARCVRHRMHDPAQRRGRRAGDGRAPAAAARDRDDAGCAGLRGAARDRAPAEMAGADALSTTRPSREQRAGLPAR